MKKNEEFFRRGTESQSVSLVTLLTGLFGGFFINLLSTPFENGWSELAMAGFSMLLLTFFAIIVFVEIFRKKLDTVRRNARTKVLSESELFEKTLEEYPEFRFPMVYRNLVLLAAILIVISVGLLAAGNYRMAHDNRKKDQEVNRQHTTDSTLMRSLVQQVAAQDTALIKLEDSLKITNRDLCRLSSVKKNSTK